MSDSDFSLHDLAVYRGDRCLIRGLTLRVSAGDMVHLAGPNGCGKTSLLRVMAGLRAPESGEIRWRGRPLRQQLSTFHQQLGWLSHRAGLKADLTLHENLSFDDALRRHCGDVRLREILDQLGLASRLHVRAGGLSAGQRRRAALARVLLSSAPLWLLDEPLTNLDTAGRALTLALMSDHAANGGMIVFAAHHDVALDVPVRKLEWAL